MPIFRKITKKTTRKTISCCFAGEWKLCRTSTMNICRIQEWEMMKYFLLPFFFILVRLLLLKLLYKPFSIHSPRKTDEEKTDTKSERKTHEEIYKFNVRAWISRVWVCHSAKVLSLFAFASFERRKARPTVREQQRHTERKWNCFIVFRRAILSRRPCLIVDYMYWCISAGWLVVWRICSLSYEKWKMIILLCDISEE